MTAPSSSPTRRRSAFADRLLRFPDFVFSDGRETAHRGGWRDFFSARTGASFGGRVVVEIGCNDASLLASVAAAHPATAFVGIDWKCRALHTAAGRVAAAGLRNVALLHGRGQRIRRYFADGELDEIWVLHPDPCDKARELPNRLVAEPFLLDVHAVLRPAAESVLVVKTDHRAYYVSSLALAERDGIHRRYALSAISADFWNDEAVLRHVAGRAFAGRVTPYEERFRKKRKPIHYLEFRPRAEGIDVGGIRAVDGEAGIGPVAAALRARESGSTQGGCPPGRALG